MFVSEDRRRHLMQSAEHIQQQASLRPYTDGRTSGVIDVTCMAGKRHWLSCMDQAAQDTIKHPQNYRLQIWPSVKPGFDVTELQNKGILPPYSQKCCDSYSDVTWTGMTVLEVCHL